MAHNKEVILERLKLLREYVNDLKEMQGIDIETYEEDKLLRRAVERTLHLSIEACLDIGRQLIAQEDFPIPKDNKAVFEILIQEGVLPGSIRSNLISLTGFRNLIVHDYANIDNSIVLGILLDRLVDLNRFAQAIVEYIQEK